MLLNEDGKRCVNGLNAFTQLLNTAETTDAARDSSLRFKTSMEFMLVSVAGCH
jgi:hypothetical protein